MIIIIIILTQILKDPSWSQYGMIYGLQLHKVVSECPFSWDKISF